MLNRFLYSLLLGSSCCLSLIGQSLPENKRIVLSFASGVFTINDQPVKQLNTECVQSFFGKPDSVVIQHSEFRDFYKGSDGSFKDGLKIYRNWIYYYNKQGICFITNNNSPGNEDSLNLRMRIFVNDSIAASDPTVKRMGNCFHGTILFDGKSFNYEQECFVKNGSCNDSARMLKMKKMFPANTSYTCFEGNPTNIKYTADPYERQRVEFSAARFLYRKRIGVIDVFWDKGE